MRPMSLICALTAAASLGGCARQPALQGQEKSLQQRIADDLIALAGGVHPGYRIAHAKGIVVTGTFAPSRGATSLSRAPHLVAASTPVIARYSNGSGVPDDADNSPNAVPRGLALRFQLPNGAYTDIVANSAAGSEARGRVAPR